MCGKGALGAVGTLGALGALGDLGALWPLGVLGALVPFSACDMFVLSLLGKKREGKQISPCQAAENLPGCPRHIWLSPQKGITGWGPGQPPVWWNPLGAQESARGKEPGPGGGAGGQRVLALPSPPCPTPNHL